MHDNANLAFGFFSALLGFAPCGVRERKLSRTPPWRRHPRKGMLPRKGLSNIVQSRTSWLCHVAAITLFLFPGRITIFSFPRVARGLKIASEMAKCFFWFGVPPPPSFLAPSFLAPSSLAPVSLAALPLFLVFLLKISPLFRRLRYSGVSVAVTVAPSAL